jgi:hypothetical protein
VRERFQLALKARRVEMLGIAIALLALMIVVSSLR